MAILLEGFLILPNIQVTATGGGRDTTSSETNFNKLFYGPSVINYKHIPQNGMNGLAHVEDKLRPCPYWKHVVLWVLSNHLLFLSEHNPEGVPCCHLQIIIKLVLMAISAECWLHRRRFMWLNKDCCLETLCGQLQREVQAFGLAQLLSPEVDRSQAIPHNYLPMRGPGTSSQLCKTLLKVQGQEHIVTKILQPKEGGANIKIDSPSAVPRWCSHETSSNSSQMTEVDKTDETSDLTKVMKNGCLQSRPSGWG